MNLTTLIKNLGDDADLLTKSDRWLETERRDTAQEMDELAQKLRAIMLAQNLKSVLQQTNRVALQQLMRDEHGNMTDIAISISDLPRAIKAVDNPHDVVDQVNAATQIMTWNSDGYDVPTSSQLSQE